MSEFGKVNGLSGTSTAELLKNKSKVQSGGGEAFAEHLKSALNEVMIIKKR